MKFAGKWIELEIIILSEVTQTQKDKHGMYLLISGLEVKYRITNLQSTAPERLENKEDPKWDAWISLGRGNRRVLLGKLGAEVERWELEGVVLTGSGPEADERQYGRRE